MSSGSGSSSPPTCQSCCDLRQGHILISAASLRDGVGRGCKACSLLRDAIAHFQPFDGVGQIALIVDCALYVYVDKELVIELFTDSGYPVKWRNIGRARSPYPDGTSEQPLELMKAWLRTCLDEHSVCDVQTPSRLPTRVIDVGSSADDARLYVSRPDEVQEYVALSHCWGGSSPVKTTTATIGAHQQVLQFTAETQTFADAVFMTRLLGYRYLWIDALCILQDDDEDRLKETCKMKDVYRSAVVTLSADAAADPSGGLFGSMLERATAHRTYPITTIGPGNEPATVYARRRWSPPCDPHSAPHSALAPEPTKLSSRAWALQERVLSPRLLRFFKEEIVWSCYSLGQCECRLLPSATPMDDYRHLVPAFPFDALRDDWPKLVTEFTSKDLTVAKDRLPALSGIASLVSEGERVQYLAGLWLDDIAYSLMWISDHRRAKKPIARLPTQDYAPSWSWASIDGPVTYIDRFVDELGSRRTGQDIVQPLLVPVQASTRPMTKNIWGPVEKGFLTVKGQVLPVEYLAAAQVWRPCPPPRPANDESQSQDNIPAWSMAAMSAALATATPPQIEPTVIFDVHDGGPQQDREPERYALLRAGRYIWGGSTSTQSTEVVALLLVWAGDVQGVQAYRRRGVVLHAFDSKYTWEDIPSVELVLC
ncbi:hypothetical protein QQZ08_008186 [Neonectria magnoliae]|uniref:Heterokaryon incompatibility domain-containing protein n=1 Tax=Neonectria magnoliae TaxID=2732573 RepID=A0ABR1HVS2_9HYPO